jgi:riboflavin synthase
MFSGIVSRIGTIEAATPGGAGRRLSIRADFSPQPEPGASVAVNGVCLTIERISGGMVEVTAVAETVSRTTLGMLEPGSRVNLERALRVGDELGGHWVQGHVDGVGTVASVERGENDVRIGIEIPEPLRRFVAPKGSLALDGTSLTVAAWRDPVAVVALVPHTLAHTIASDYRVGTRVNLESDLIARYLDRLLAADARPVDAPVRTR